MRDKPRRSLVDALCVCAVWVTVGLGPSVWAAAPVVLFDEKFDGFANGQTPTSIVEVRREGRSYAEVIGRRYAVRMAGNAHLLVMPRVENFELTFTAEPHPQAWRAPQLHIMFRTDAVGRRGYRLVHWFGSYNRLDLNVWDHTLPEPVNRRLASPRVKAFRLPAPEPVRFKLIVEGHTFRFFRNGEKLLEFTDADKLITGRGNIALDGFYEGAYGVVAPLYFDDIRVTTTDVTALGRVVFKGQYEVPPELRAVHVPIVHRVEITEIRDTGLDEIRTDLPAGRIYRVQLDLDFPPLPPGKPGQRPQRGREMAGRTPYVRLETTRGEPIAEQAIYNGVLGSILPGRGSGSAQLLRLITEHDPPARYGMAVRTCRGADATGPQHQAMVVTHLPKDFHVVAGWQYFLDQDHIAACGPVEAIFKKDGALIYAGDPLRPGQCAWQLRSPASAGIAARVAKTNQYRDGFLQRLVNDHYFLEGEPVRFEVTLALGAGARVPAHQVAWDVRDAYLRGPGETGTAWLTHAQTDEAKTLRRIGRTLRTTGAIRPKCTRPGVYWFRYRAGPKTGMAAFSIVPKKQRPGHTAARASALPEIFGQFYPMQAWRKDVGHYVTTTGARSDDWIEMVHAFNMKAAANRRRPELVKQSEAGWCVATLEGMDTPQRVYPAGGRLWLARGFTDACVKDFMGSTFYKAHPADRVLTDRKVSKEDKRLVVLRHHFKQWVDHWCAVRTARESAQRAVIDRVRPGLDTSSYGPPLVNTFYYGNLYSAKYYGWDWRLKKSARRLMHTWQMETYAHDFGRPPESYTPSIALTKLSIPELNCRWEVYGAAGYVVDGRTACGRPPHGLGFPSRQFITHQVTELSLGPWYFDGQRFAPAGQTHVAPGFGGYVQDMMLGMADAFRIVADAHAVRPVRSPGFVRSYAAAERDPSWQRPSVCNAAAEAPAYAYVESRLAGLAGGFFLDIADVNRVNATHCDILVLPPTRGATPEQVAAIRRHYAQGVALVCFDDCTGLEDIFGVKRLATGVPIRSVQRASGEGLLGGLPRAVRVERVHHSAEVFYEPAGATEVLSGMGPKGQRAAPVLVVHRPKGRPGAVLFTLGATDVGRRRESLLRHYEVEGEVVSPLIRRSLRTALRAIARPVVEVTEPASVLAFVRADGSLYVVVQEASYPNTRGPVRVLLRLHGPGAGRAKVTCAKPVEVIRPASPHELGVGLHLEPDEVVPLVVTGMKE